MVHGNLVLVASGDLALGGRNALEGEGRFDQSFSATTIDHVYGDLAPTAAPPPGDPLAGLDSLATQVAASGVSSVTGDVLIDDRLWETGPGHEAPIPPIFVNDNI
ncbi:MAG: peptidase S13, partial [Chloroflexi bacterium]|nr:peptidase S13 [Chloroflexota bacterium]